MTSRCTSASWPSDLHQERTLQDTLDGIVSGAVDNVPGTQRAHIELGICSMLSLQLYVEGENLGALNRYNGEPDAFDDESEHIGLLFASHAAVAMAGSQRQQQLTLAMVTRDLIGQAMGILMERYKLTGDQAFALLVRASQTSNTKLRDVAEHLATGGELVGSTMPKLSD